MSGGKKKGTTKEAILEKMEAGDVTYTESQRCEEDEGEDDGGLANLEATPDSSFKTPIRKRAKIAG